MKILIVKLSAIGDVIHTLPALNALRRHWPGARITWLVEEAASDLVIGHPSLDRVLVSRRKRWVADLRGRRWRRSLGEAMQFFRALRDTRYDLILDFQALLKSGVLIALARGRRKVGFDRGMEHMERSHLFLNERIPPVSMEIHALDRGLMLIGALGVPAGDVEYRIPVTDRDRDRVLRYMADVGIDPARPIVAINPMAKWETKLWDPAKFSRLADRLVETRNAQVVFTGGPEDRPAVEGIIGRTVRGTFNLAGRTRLKELAAVFEGSNVVISTDTGPMHLAAAIGTPVVALFGPTAPWRTGPHGDKHRVVRSEPPCSPCFKRKCSRPSCMESITVDQVMDGVDALGVIDA